MTRSGARWYWSMCWNIAPRHAARGARATIDGTSRGGLGGDYNRIWFKTEGQRNTAFKADYDVDFQLLYGRFIQKYYDFQIGASQVRRDESSGRHLIRSGMVRVGKILM